MLHKQSLESLLILSDVLGCFYKGVQYQMGLFSGPGFLHL